MGYGGGGEIRSGMNRVENHGKIEEAFSEEHLPARGKAWRGECDYFFGEPGRDCQTRKGTKNTIAGAEPGEENRGGSRGDDLHGAFEQQGGPTRITCAIHTEWGVRVMKAVNSPRVETLV